jgi:DUF1680 family protein
MMPKSTKLSPSERRTSLMSHVHLVKGIDETGKPVEEFFFSEKLAEWETAAHVVADRPHEKLKMSIEEAVEKYGIYFRVTWVDENGYHEEVWREFSRAEERHGDLLFDLPDILDPAWEGTAAAEIHPLSPTQVDRKSVLDLH